jgi:hypothetical protein
MGPTESAEGFESSDILSNLTVCLLVDVQVLLQL